MAIGFILPLLRSFLFSMPVFYPVAIAMAFELATYGLVAGLMYGRSRWQCVRALYRALIAAMLAGRIVWGIAEVLLLGVGENAIPGIAIQLILIPAIMLALNKTGLTPLKKRTISGKRVEES